jgi:hypothetical protein
MRTGLLAEFGTPEEMLRAIHDLRGRGYRRLDAFTPYPVPGVERALDLRRSPLTWIVFPIAMLGAGLAYLVQLWCNAYDYPLNVGGRPLHSAPAFIPITFETAVLTASVTGVLVFLLLSGLPELHSPVADVEGFWRASIDRFWVGVDDRDPRFDGAELVRVFRGLGAISVGQAQTRRRA